MDYTILPKAVEEGIVTQHVFDLHKETLTMRVDVLSENIHSIYDLAFLHISRLLYEGENTHQWEKLELTELWIDEKPEQSTTKTWTVTFNFWEVALLTLRCTEIMVNGNPLH